MLWPNLSDLLGDIHWAVIGGVGTRHYMPERATRDLDIIVHHDDSRRVADALAGAGYVHVADLRIGGSAWRSEDGIYVDVIESAAPWVRDALVQAMSNRDAQGLPILPLPHFSLMKFQAARAQDLADLTRMFGLASDKQLSEVRTMFRLYEPGGLDDLESLIELGRLETDG